jgi:5-hydroxyisourate hydrolase-like protein (transthyretin family)
MRLFSYQIARKLPSGAKARVDSPGFIRGLKPPTHSRLLIALQYLYRVAIFLAATSIVAQPAPKPTSGYRIAGMVVNAASGEPVRRATVAVLSEEDRQTVASVETDNEGRFALEGLAAGKYPLTASKRGFLTAYYDQHDGGYNTAIVTGEGQDTGSLVFRLVPGAVLHGVVSGDGGDPVEGAKVMLFVKPHNHNPGARITQASEASTDDTGAYEFDGLTAGEYLLAVTAAPWYAMSHSAAGAKRQPEAEASTALDVAYPVTYFDSTTEEASATSIVLAGGSRDEVDFNLHAVPALHLIIETHIPDEGRISNKHIELHRTILGTVDRSGSTRWPFGTETGTVEIIGVAPGHYQLTQGNPPRIVELDATVNQQIDPSLGTPEVAVSGNLRTSLGDSLPDHVMLTLVSSDDTHPREPIRSEHNNGQFAFASVPPGVWELWADISGKILPITSLTVGNRTRSGNQLTVRDKPVKVVATVSLSETRVEGFARKEGKGQAGVMIVLVPRNPVANRSLFRRDQSDSDGSFALRDVAPGQYTVVAIEAGWDLDWARPEVISRYLSQGIPVTVTESSGKLVRLSQAVPVQSR